MPPAIPRRTWLGLSLAFGGCSVLPERPYLATTDWPLVVLPPPARPPAPHAPVLLLRPVRAAAGLEARGLRTLMPDGSLHTDFYQEWAAPPADAVTDQLQAWLAASGLFAGVVVPGSRLAANDILEADLTALWAVQASRQARASLGYVLIDQRGGNNRVVLQDSVTGTALLANEQPATVVAAQIAALADAFRQIVTRLRSKTRLLGKSVPT